jgi:hypothetical protein
MMKLRLAFYVYSFSMIANTLLVGDAQAQTFTPTKIQMYNLGTVGTATTGSSDGSGKGGNFAWNAFDATGKYLGGNAFADGSGAPTAPSVTNWFCLLLQQE